MKTPLITVLIIAPCLAFAQTPDVPAPNTTAVAPVVSKPPVPDPAKELATMTERLKLTPAQQDQIRPILEAETAKRKSILADTSLNSMEQHQEIIKVHRESLQQIKAIFTPEQMAQIQQGMNHPAPSPTNPVTTATH